MARKRWKSTTTETSAQHLLQIIAVYYYWSFPLIQGSLLGAVTLSLNLNKKPMLYGNHHFLDEESWVIDRFAILKKALWELPKSWSAVSKPFYLQRSSGFLKCAVLSCLPLAPKKKQKNQRELQQVYAYRVWELHSSTVRTQPEPCWKAIF